MTTYSVYVNCRNDIDRTEFEWLEVGRHETRKEAEDHMKGLLKEYEQNLRDHEAISKVYSDEGVNEVFGSDGFGHYISFDFHVKRTGTV